MTARRGPAAAVTALSDPAAQLRVDAACRTLALPTVRAEAGRIAEAAARERLSHGAFLAEVLTAEVDDRDSRRRLRMVREAKFPRSKRLRACRALHGMGRNIGGAYNTANEWSVPPIPATVSVPDSLSSLLQRFRFCFTAPGYEVFTAMFTGFILRPVERTVCGMLTGAGLAGIWHHSRAHRFFSGTRWDVQQGGLILATLVMEILLAPNAAILLAIDETLTRRRGPKVFAASWWHDGSAAGAAKIGYGNSWVVLAIVVTVPFCRRPIALPILFTLCVKGDRSKPDLGRDLLDQVAEAFPTRTIHLVGDAAYGAGHFAGLGNNITITTRARSNAVFHHPTPASTGKRGRPRLRGERIGTPTDIANHATKNNIWVDTPISRYGTTMTARTTEITGLWFGDGSRTRLSDWPRTIPVAGE